MRLPKNVNHRAPAVRRDLASSLRNTGIVAPATAQRGRSGAGRRGPPPTTRSSRRCAGPCARTPATAATTGRRTPGGPSGTPGWSARPSSCGRRSRATTHSLARAFDRIRALLAERGYLSDDDGETVTAQGERLARLWGESDLLAAECLRHGVWDGLEPAELAAVVSALVYESRRDLGPVPRVPTGPVSRGAGRDRAAVGRAGGRRAPAPGRPHPRARPRASPGRCTGGRAASRCPRCSRPREQNGVELSAGDFVRWCRQVLDLLDQIADVAGRDTPVGQAAATAARSVRRGVVAAGTA